MQVELSLEHICEQRLGDIVARDENCRPLLFTLPILRVFYSIPLCKIKLYMRKLTIGFQCSQPGTLGSFLIFWLLVIAFYQCCIPFVNKPGRSLLTHYKHLSNDFSHVNDRLHGLLSGLEQVFHFLASNLNCPVNVEAFVAQLPELDHH